MMKRIALFMAYFGWLAIPSLAYDFEVDGIYYDSLSAKTCEVVRGSYPWESVFIPEKVQYNGFDFDVVRISHDAFYAQTKVNRIRIPASVTAIGSEAFIHCKSLTTIDVDADNPIYSSYQGALYNKQQTCLIKVPAGKKEFTIPDGVKEIGDDALHICQSLKRITIPNGVIRIGDNAFAGCDSLASIDIGSSVEYIGAYAFSGCKALISLTIPSSVKEVGCNAFSFCTVLISVSLPKGIQTISNGMFNGCTSLKNVNIPIGVTSLGDFCFAQCDSLRVIDIPNTVTSLGSNSFYGCSSLYTFEIPEVVTTIGNQSFEYCSKIDTVTLPSNVSIIGDKVFNGCKGLERINVSEDNTAYKGLLGALYDHKLTQLIKVPSLVKSDSIPETVNHISEYAYFKCGNLTKVKIPETVKKIGKWAFVGCDLLDSVFMAKPVDLSETYLPSGTRTLYVPNGKKSFFENSDYYENHYSLFKSIEEYGETPTSIYYTTVEDAIKDPVIYSIQGVKMGLKKNLRKGVYIIGSQKVIIK